jgi:hypothetical protein
MKCGQGKPFTITSTNAKIGGPAIKSYQKGGMVTKPDDSMAAGNSAYGQATAASARESGRDYGQATAAAARAGTPSMGLGKKK